MQRRILFDYDAFQLDVGGRLVFARPLSAHPELAGRVVDPRNFCVDMVEKDGKQYMASVFCSPRPMAFVKEDLLTITPPSSANKIFECSLILVSMVFLVLAFF